MARTKHFWDVIAIHRQRDIDGSIEFTITRKCNICGQVDFPTLYAGFRGYEGAQVRKLYEGIDNPDAHKE